MKRKLTQLIPTLVLTALICGCGTVSWNGTADTRARAQSIAKTVSYWPTITHLRTHPNDIDQVRIVKNGIEALLADSVVDPGALAGVLSALPIKELQAEDVQILITGGLLLIESAGGEIQQVDKPAIAQAVAIGLRDGLELALRIVAPPQPPQRPNET